MSISRIDYLMHSTLLIEILDDNDVTISTGTGFIYNFCSNAVDKTTIPALVTNKHVIEGAKKICLTFTLADENNKPLYGQQHKVTLSKDYINADIILHPSSNVDLAILTIAPIINILRGKNIKVYYTSIFKELIPSKLEWENFNSMEEVIMIGYPKGLWDKSNNLPLFRKGVTSSHPSFDFNGNKEFLIDAACFPGSSGSPVFLYNIGSYWDKQADCLKNDNRLKFLGILYSGPIHNAAGIATDQNIVLVSGKITYTSVMINLGSVIKSTVLLDFEKLLQ